MYLSKSEMKYFENKNRENIETKMNKSRKKITNKGDYQDVLS